MYCFGTGVRASRTASSIATKYQSRKLAVQKACPVCGINVSKLERHLRKAHNGQGGTAVQPGGPSLVKVKIPTGQPEIPVSKATNLTAPHTSPNYVSCKICCRAVHKDKMNGHMRRKHSTFTGLVEQASLPAPSASAGRLYRTEKADPGLSSQYVTKADARLGRGLHASDTFALPAYSQVGNTTLHQKGRKRKKRTAANLTQPASTILKSQATNTPTGFTRCPECGVPVLAKNLLRHSKKAHSQNRPTAALHETSGRSEARMTTAPSHELANEVLQQRLNRSMDATKDFAHSFREQGRYGSHPSHDNYDDEGRP
jgi:predicted RNA-binding Zn-ribbon protein involved in translation (DUF1610 family)/uncharacterized C2H2 Zn-finger protein